MIKKNTKELYGEYKIITNYHMKNTSLAMAEAITKLTLLLQMT